MNYYMKQKSDRLKPVEKLAEDKAKTATEAMVTARQTTNQHELKLAELLRYRTEYLEQFQNKGKTGIAAAELMQYQQFISNLDNAIEQQQEVVRNAKLELAQRQQHWRSKDSEKRAINNAVNRFRKQEIRAQDQKEQHALDEHNIQSHLRKDDKNDL